LVQLITVNLLDLTMSFDLLSSKSIKTDGQYLIYAGVELQDGKKYDIRVRRTVGGSLVDPSKASLMSLHQQFHKIAKNLFKQENFPSFSNASVTYSSKKGECTSTLDGNVHLLSEGAKENVLKIHQLFFSKVKGSEFSRSGRNLMVTPEKIPVVLPKPVVEAPPVQPVAPQQAPAPPEEAASETTDPAPSDVEEDDPPTYRTRESGTDPLASEDEIDSLISEEEIENRFVESDPSSFSKIDFSKLSVEDLRTSSLNQREKGPAYQIYKEIVTGKGSKTVAHEEMRVWIEDRFKEKYEELKKLHHKYPKYEEMAKKKNWGETALDGCRYYAAYSLLSQIAIDESIDFYMKELKQKVL
jgi:hypothetical protein